MTRRLILEDQPAVRPEGYIATCPARSCCRGIKQRIDTPPLGGNGMKHHDVVIDFSRRGMVELFRRLMIERSRRLPKADYR